MIATVGLLLAAVLPLGKADSSPAGRWQLCPGGERIVWNVAAEKALPHNDFLEMSGLRCSLIFSYAVDRSRRLAVRKDLYWPWVRKYQDDTHGTYSFAFPEKELPYPALDGRRIDGTVREISLDGTFGAVIDCGNSLELRRTVFPSVDRPAAIELAEVLNRGRDPVTLSPSCGVKRWKECLPDGLYLLTAALLPSEPVVIAPGKSAVWTLSTDIRRVDKDESAYDGVRELAARRRRIEELTGVAVLESGDPVIDAAFRFAKLRAGESIFATAGGLMHSPGGGSYYAATWCNDQIEYAGPWFAFTGDRIALEASMNAYRQYLAFMGPDYDPIPSSVIAQGRSHWNGAGDRGDAAMWAYGASRFVLTSDRRDWAKELLGGIRWTLEFCRRKLNAEGVVLSDRDELEGRLPAGKANLCTSSLYYDALVHAAIIEREIGDGKRAEDYENRARALRAAIERYFGAEYHGFKTYRYYENCPVLRSWIGIPLCMGIDERAADTAKALFSPYLRTADAGLLCAEGDGNGTTWDRSLLYAFRGVFACGVGDEAVKDLHAYSAARLLGEHVPYPIEAWPEGGRRHLAAESALYCRVILEGLFGLDPSGFGTFRTTGRFPAGMKQMKLGNLRAFDGTAGTAGGIELLAPAPGATVETHTEGQKRHFAKSPWERRQGYTQSAFRDEMGKPHEKAGGEYRALHWPKAVEFKWKAEPGVEYDFVIREKKGNEVFWRAGVKGGATWADSFKIGCEYTWTVTGGGRSATASFRTSPAAPRIVRMPGVDNCRDMGGWRVHGGGRVRQGLVYRTAQFDGKDLDAAYIRSHYGIRTDIDLRGSGENKGRTDSPLGPDVTYLHYPSKQYDGLGTPEGKKAFADVFRVFLDEKNYPIAFHCIYGQDRTGSVAFVLEALLGVGIDDLVIDWETTHFWIRYPSIHHAVCIDGLEAYLKTFKGRNVNENAERYALSCGFTADDIARFRSLMLTANGETK